MKKRKELTTILMLLVSCGDRSHQQLKALDTAKKDNHIQSMARKAEIDQVTYRPCINLSDSIFQLNDSLEKKALIGLFPEDFERMQPSMILSITRATTLLDIADYGICRIYEIVLSDMLPDVMAKRMVLLFNKKRGNGVLLPLLELSPFKVSAADNTVLIAGTYLVRSKGYFAIYRFDKSNGFNIVFDSSADLYCDNGIPVYNSSLDCISYDPFLLRIDNHDINGDGINDLVFTGKALFYCSGLETGYGRKERKALRKLDLRIRFQTIKKSDSLSWTLLDTVLCTKIRSEFSSKDTVVVLSPEGKAIVYPNDTPPPPPPIIPKIKK